MEWFKNKPFPRKTRVILQDSYWANSCMKKTRFDFLIWTILDLNSRSQYVRLDQNGLWFNCPVSFLESLFPKWCLSKVTFLKTFLYKWLYSKVKWWEKSYTRKVSEKYRFICLFVASFKIAEQWSKIAHEHSIIINGAKVKKWAKSSTQDHFLSKIQYLT